MCRCVVLFHVIMTTASSPWMFRFELGVLRQKSVANTSKMLWRRRGFNSQVKEQLIKTRRAHRESEMRSALPDRFFLCEEMPCCRKLDLLCMSTASTARPVLCQASWKGLTQGLTNNPYLLLAIEIWLLLMQTCQQ